MNESIDKTLARMLMFRHCTNEIEDRLPHLAHQASNEQLATTIRYALQQSSLPHPHRLGAILQSCVFDDALLSDMYSSRHVLTPMLAQTLLLSNASDACRSYRAHALMVYCCELFDEPSVYGDTHEQHLRAMAECVHATAAAAATRDGESTTHTSSPE